MARHGVVTAELVGRRFFWRGAKGGDGPGYGQWAAYRRLRALQDLGLILTDKPFAREPAALRVTRAGARLADVGVGPAPLVVSQLRHTIGVVWLAEYLLAEHPSAELRTERELRALRYREQRDGTRQPERGRTPDALLLFPDGGAKAPRRVAVELDLTRKDRRALERMIHQYDHEKVDAIWWFVTAGRVEHITEVVRALNAHDRFEVRAWPA